MLHTKFQVHRPFGIGGEDFLRFLPYMVKLLGVCQISKQNLAGPCVGPYSPERITYEVCLVSTKTLAEPGGGP